MNTSINLINLETLFPSEIKDVKNHLNHIYEKSCVNDYTKTIINLTQENSNTSNIIPITIKSEPEIVNLTSEEIEVCNKLNNPNRFSSFEINKETQNLHTNLLNPLNCSTDQSNPFNQIEFLNRDPDWINLVQSKIVAPINSNESHTEILLMILKAQHDNQILFTNISKRLEKIEKHFHIESSSPPITTNIVISSVQSDIPIQQFDNHFTSKNFAQSDQQLPISDFFFKPMENDFHLHQFENNLNQISYQTSVNQFLRQKISGNIRETIRRMIFALITPEFSLKFNRTGANNKYAFKIKLEPLIKEALMGIFDCSERDIENNIVRTLKETKDKFSSRKK